VLVEIKYSPLVALITVRIYSLPDASCCNSLLTLNTLLAQDVIKSGLRRSKLQDKRKQIQSQASTSMMSQPGMPSNNIDPAILGATANANPALLGPVLMQPHPDLPPSQFHADPLTPVPLRDRLVPLNSFPASGGSGGSEETPQRAERATANVNGFCRSHSYILFL
jgi:hypothetical protein